ncbi:MAG TPA: response regulator [Polyangiaceae bacterium]|nr:response regulator [Polyangiaceae bacterium]
MTEPPILLVEDNDDDADLTAMAFQDARISNPIVRVRDGVEALARLHGEQAGAAPAPVVVLLDLKLPRIGGIEVLKSIRANEATKYLPVVILTSSDEEIDRLQAYAHFANSYVRKPVDYDAFVAASRQLGLYWTVTNVPVPPQQATE